MDSAAIFMTKFYLWICCLKFARCSHLIPSNALCNRSVKMWRRRGLCRMDIHVRRVANISDMNVQATGIFARALPATQSSRHSPSDAMRFIWPVQTSVTEAVAFWLIRPDPNQSQFITQRVMATLYSTRCSPAGQDKSSQNNTNRNVC